jgi:uridine kinase
MPPLLIGVVGGSGSGKTTVARAIYDFLGRDAAFIDMDAYYRDLTHLTMEERRQVNYDHPDSIDMELMADHLARLRAGKSILKPVYDFGQHNRSSEVVQVIPRDVILVDGILLFADQRLRALFDIKIFVDVDDDVRFIRRLQRDVAERGRTMDDVIRQYLTTVRPMHLEFVEPSKRWADVILPEGGHNRIGVEMILARVELELSRRRRVGQDAGRKTQDAGKDS